MTSAWMPCVRPIMGVCRWRSACSRTAARRRSRPSSSTSAASRSWSANAVSTTSDDVSPRCSQRPSSPTFSATEETKAMTSCFTSASIARMRADVDARALAQAAGRLGRRLAPLGQHVDERQLDVEPALQAGLLGPEAAHGGTRVAVDHRRAGRCCRSRRRRARSRRARRLLPDHAGDGRDDELRDAVAAADADRLAAEVHEQHLHLAAIVGVDRPGGVEERQPLAHGEAAPRPHLPLEPGRDRERDARRHEAAVAGGERHVVLDVGQEVHAGRLRRHVARQRQGLGGVAHADDRNAHLRGHSRSTSSPTGVALHVAEHRQPERARRETRAAPRARCRRWSPRRWHAATSSSGMSRPK